MKTRFVLMAAMISIALCGLFASCEKDKNDSPSYSKEQLVGKWNADKMESDGETVPYSQYGEMYMIFRSDNSFSTYSHSYIGPESEPQELNGTWSSSGSSINLTIAGQTASLPIKELSQNTMVLISKSQRRYNDGHVEEAVAYLYLNRDESWHE